MLGHRTLGPRAAAGKPAGHRAPAAARRGADASDLGLCSLLLLSAPTVRQRRRGITNTSELLDGANDKIARITATHAEAGHLFVHCAAHLGGLQGGAPWQAWECHRADAVRYAKDARCCLCRAGGAVEAAGDVFRVVQWRSGSRLPREAKDLLRGARGDVSKALHALRDMHHAIVLEFFDAWMVLNQNR
ncbi:hypothetical protein E2562_036847 [Oryza meyeriana var. granulata]|uniref:Uncharacterized protein n=1 Tax=Oryza meyeriana var. granulata TaxID=110450 RepID=A0A6G1E8J7_9ORYZ|nr:hypothetical protein E2562_036847 [Oryza meyeriana var. granulata]